MPSAVTVSLVTVEIPTYALGPDSPYLSFAWRRRQGHYPYSVRLDLSTEPRPVKHRVIVLENRYLRAEILPDMGGRLYRLYDKVAGQETFMVPPTVKFQNIALRGAWIAGGIEWNFGQRGHTVHTVDPVSWTIRSEPDGSASVFVGSIVRPAESRWSVRISLKPDRAAMDVEIQTMGPRTLPGLMYWWSNATVEVTDDSRFFYYGLYAGDEAAHSWPMTDGLDFRWYRNRVIKADMFLMEPQRDYLAFYDYGRQHGLAQIANRFIAPGQKYFTWGSDERGHYWDYQLSDSGQTYCEIQRGRLPTQGMTEPIPPMSTDRWQETWMALNDTRGFDHLENDMALAVSSASDRTEIRLLSAVERSHLRMEAFNEDHPLGSWDIDRIEPGSPLVLTTAEGDDRRYNRIRIIDANSQILVDWEEFVFADADWTSHKPPFDQAKASLEELFHEAQRRRFLYWPAVDPDCVCLYDRILQQDPGHTGALRAMAEINLFNGFFDKAAAQLGKATKRCPNDPTLLTLLGWTLLRMDKCLDAVKPFTVASRFEPGRRDALVGLAWAYVKASDLAAAEKTVDELLADRPNDRWASLLKVIILRRNDQVAEAVERLSALLKIDPLWGAANAEAALLDMPKHLADGQRRLADDSVSAALAYLDLGLWDDAQTILRIDESDEPWSPMVRLAHLAYAQLKTGDTSGALATIQDLHKAPLEHASPWATTSIVVLTELTRAYPDEANLFAMLGNALASRSRLADALAAWKTAVDLGADHTVVHGNLAAVESHLGHNERALEHYRRAWRLSKANINLFSEFDRFLSQMGLHDERESIYNELPDSVHHRPVVALRRVPQLLDLERYDDALGELSARQYYSGEMAEYTIRRAFHEALLGKAVNLMNACHFAEAHEVLKEGLTYPRNQNVGRQWSLPTEAMINYMLGLTAEAAGRPQEAQDYWLAAAREHNSDGEVFQAYEMMAWLALGDVPRVIAMSHQFEALGRGEKEPTWWFLFLNTKSTLTLVHGLGQLTKQRVGEAQAMWARALADEPAGRFLRPHVNMSTAVLERMCRKVTGAT